MPKAVSDYTKNVIYKIQHNDDDSLLYVGHTINFIKRKSLHKYGCIKKTTPVYKMIRDNGGWECFTMIVLKDFPCASKTEACIEEDKIMRKMKASMNTLRAYTSLEEKKEYAKEYMKEYVQVNKEHIRERTKEYNQEYYQVKRDSIIEKNKEYHQINRDNILEKKKEHYEANREKFKEYHEANRNAILERNKKRVECDCGCIVTKNYMSRHKKSKKHFESLNC